MEETQFGAETKTSDLNWYTTPTERGATTPFPNEGGNTIKGYTKQLVVNVMGHSMVSPLEDDEALAKFRQLFSRHRLKTVTYCAVFWSFGICVAFLGPTLLDLECRISSVFSEMSWIFFSQSFFTLVGSACGGVLVQRFGCHPVLLVSTVMISVTLATVPSCSFILWLAAVLALMGFFMGTIDTVANISMIQLYGRNVAPFLQALHFCYGLGAFLSPMIAEPFLLNKDCTQWVNSTRTERSQGLSGNVSQPLQEIAAAKRDSRIQNAFWIMAGIQTPVIALVSVVILRDRMSWSSDERIAKPHPDIQEKESYEMRSPNYQSSSQEKGTVESLPNVEEAVENRPQITREQLVLITLSTAALLFVYEGLQAGYGGYIFSYAVKSIAGMSMNEAAYLNACFWGTFAFGRLISIFIATRLAPYVMLFCNIFGCMLAMSLMLSFRHSHGILYAGTCLFGIFLSSVYPTAISLAESYINVTSQITSILVVFGATGEMIIPVVIGHEFDALGPASFLISGVIMTVLSFLIYVFLVFVAETVVKQSSDLRLMTRIKNIIQSSKDGGEGEDPETLKHHVPDYKRMGSDISESSLCDLGRANGVGDSAAKVESIRL